MANQPSVGREIAQPTTGAIPRIRFSLPRVALALSGGGAKGDFEVGAVRYLYDHQKLKPSIITGTSVGAISALKLAEGEPASPAKPDSTGHIQGLAGLESIWFSLKRNSDMWSTEPFIANLEKAAQEFFTDVGVSMAVSVLTGPVGLLSLLFTDTPGSLDALKKQAAAARSARSLFNLNPTEAIMRRPGSLKLSLVNASGIKLRLAMVALEDGGLRYMTESGAVIERDGTPTPGAPVYDPKTSPPILKKIAELESELRDLQNEMTGDTPGAPARKRPAEIAGLLRQIEDLKAQLEKNATRQPLKGDPITGALASSAIPVVFPPVRVGDKWYVDGGVRAITPVEAAVQAGADMVYAVAASAERMQPAWSHLEPRQVHSYGPGTGLVDIGARTVEDILTGEISHRDLYPYNGWGKPLIVIRPEYDIHDTMTIDAGLIRIRYAHGWMRADDTMQAYAKDAANHRTLTEQYSRDRQTTAIVLLRHRIWKMEFAIHGWKYKSKNGSPQEPEKQPVDLSQLATLRQLKRELKDLVDRRLAAGGKCPPGFQNWWMNWEAHSWSPTRQLWDATTPFAPLRKLTVTCQPAVLPVGRQITFTATATDAGKPVAATVMVEGKAIGATGQPIACTLEPVRKQVFDPETKKYYTELYPPTVTITAPGYHPEKLKVSEPTATAGAGTR